MNRALFLTASLAAVCLGCGDDKIAQTENKPVAKFTATPSTVRPQVIRVDGSESFTAVGTLSKYQWSFGDQKTETTTPTALHAFTKAGTYTITLVVLDEQETPSDPATQEVTIATVNTELPKAKIAGPSTAAPGKAVSFDAAESLPKGDIQNYAWDFGDPSSNANNTYSGANAVNAQHAFQSKGNYRVSLTVTDSLGQSDTTELLIAVGDGGPVANCTWSPMPATQGTELTFDGSGSSAPAGSTIKLWVWDFDDGSNQGAGKTVKHTYNVQATFKPKLTVIDDQNRTGEATCPDVVVGAPGLCVGDYAWAPANKKNRCLQPDDTTWGGVNITIDQTADGKIKGTEKFGGTTLIYSGTWSGQSFTMAGKYTESDGFGGTVTSTVTVNGMFSGCGTWTGTMTESKDDDQLGHLCTLTWNNITGTRL